MNINRLKVWLVLFFSTIVLISGVTASIIYSSSYLSPIGSNYAKEELQLLDELMSKDSIKLSKIFNNLLIEVIYVYFFKENFSLINKYF
mgnify:CR=1 FL=1